MIDLEVVDRLERWMPTFDQSFAQVTPTPFLPDATTKNVIVYAGRLSGIVDVDTVCFGDPLRTVGLTRMALLSMGAATEYIDFWTAAMGMREDRQEILDFYTATFCVDFLGEIGHAFNRNAPEPVATARQERLLTILSTLIPGLR